MSTTTVTIYLSPLEIAAEHLQGASDVPKAVQLALMASFISRAAIYNCFIEGGLATTATTLATLTILVHQIELLAERSLNQADACYLSKLATAYIHAIKYGKLNSIPATLQDIMDVTATPPAFCQPTPAPVRSALLSAYAARLPPPTHNFHTPGKEISHKKIRAAIQTPYQCISSPLASTATLVDNGISIDGDSLISKSNTPELSQPININNTHPRLAKASWYDPTFYESAETATITDSLPSGTLSIHPVREAYLRLTANAKPVITATSITTTTLRLTMAPPKKTEPAGRLHKFKAAFGRLLGKGRRGRPASDEVGW